MTVVVAAAAAAVVIVSDRQGSECGSTRCRQNRGALEHNCQFGAHYNRFCGRGSIMIPVGHSYHQPVAPSFSSFFFFSFSFFFASSAVGPGKHLLWYPSALCTVFLYSSQSGVERNSTLVARWPRRWWLIVCLCLPLKFTWSLPKFVLLSARTHEECGNLVEGEKERESFKLC